MALYKIIRFTLKSRSANFTRLNHTRFLYSVSREGIKASAVSLLRLEATLGISNILSGISPDLTQGRMVMRNLC
ncbi:hypothetical protein [Rubritalea tangerina]|uniref:hypothetical protein n=1 Tax=Rubritalea tangerina TaxID=430798 RepID=UPI0036120642